MARPFHQAHKPRVLIYCLHRFHDGALCAAPLLRGCAYRRCGWTETYRQRYKARHTHGLVRVRFPSPNLIRIALQIFDPIRVGVGKWPETRR